MMQTMRIALGMASCLATAMAVAQPHEIEARATNEVAAASQQVAGPASGATLTFEIGLSQEAYESWDGDWSNPHFMFPGATTSVPPIAQSPATASSGTSGSPAASEEPLHTVVAIVSCSISARNPHRGEGPTGADATKAKAEGHCNLTATGNGPLPPENTMFWLALLTLQQNGSYVGGAAFYRTGYAPIWRQNPSRGYPGTQVFRYGYTCVNGLHKHRAETYVYPPWPYSYTGPNPLDSDSRSATVTGC
ncbi:MAG: hypothetical protein OXJ53_19300 [Gammaproteobacteria bacterium]|nr:hypothetical protein [Gammaproteobacteria bacterium]MDE0273820.1 hypothetical protein [Gammaproteobacteria bacterium]